MTTYVCVELVENTCTTWVVQNSGLLPELSTANAYLICAAIFGVLSIAWGFKQIGKLLK
ncbi:MULTISPECIES: hypothetical protein [unclassified Acinetobacter]|uniref:hypothetical protein n=1 Tax=unclassified Acinetobacter TaxID=196816 RepID=UPI0015D13E3F|nr:MULTISPECIES: hypothetical protein [unclassified Acinetobacter]